MSNPPCERRYSSIHPGSAARTIRISVAYDTDLQRSIVSHYEKRASAVTLDNIKKKTFIHILPIEIEIFFLNHRINFEHVYHLAGVFPKTRFRAYISIIHSPVRETLVLRNQRHQSVLQSYGAFRTESIAAPSNHISRCIGQNSALLHTGQMYWLNIF